MHGGVGEALFWGFAAGWAIFELALAVHARGGTGRDPSFVPLTLSVVAGSFNPRVRDTAPHRVRVRLLREERVLALELGDPYRSYMAHTKRLIPGIW